MPDKKTLKRVEQDKREGKSVSTQAGEFVKEEMEHIREGKAWVRSTKQAIAIGLSNARRAGVALPAPKPGATSEKTRKQAQHDLKIGQEKTKSTTKTRTAAERSASARKGAQTKGAAGRSAAARKAAHTRAQRHG